MSEVLSSHGEPSLPERLEIQVDDTLVLRELIEADAEALFDLVSRNHDHLERFNNSFVKHHPTLESTRREINARLGEQYKFGIWAAETLIGFIQSTRQDPQPVAEIGYWLGLDYIGKGFMTKAVKALTRYCLEVLHYEEIVGFVAINNFTSQRLLERCGFVCISRRIPPRNISLLPYFIYRYINPPTEK